VAFSVVMIVSLHVKHAVREDGVVTAVSSRIHSGRADYDTNVDVDGRNVRVTYSERFSVGDAVTIYRIGSSSYSADDPHGVGDAAIVVAFGIGIVLVLCVIGFWVADRVPWANT
jgi:hypothetical protein